MPYRILLFLFDPICFKDSQHLYIIYWIDASKTKSEVTGSIWKLCVFYAILQFTPKWTTDIRWLHWNDTLIHLWLWQGDKIWIDLGLTFETTFARSIMVHWSRLCQSLHHRTSKTLSFPTPGTLVPVDCFDILLLPPHCAAADSWRKRGQQSIHQTLRLTVSDQKSTWVCLKMLCAPKPNG